MFYKETKVWNEIRLKRTIRIDTNLTLKVFPKHCDCQVWKLKLTEKIQEELDELN